MQGGTTLLGGGGGVRGALTWMTRVVPFITASVSTLFAIACSSRAHLVFRGPICFRFPAIPESSSTFPRLQHDAQT